MALADLPECDKDEPLLGEGYLTECVALPFLCGEYLSLYEIDWDAFDPEGRPHDVLPLRSGRSA